MLEELARGHRKQRESYRGRPLADKPAMAQQLEEKAEALKHEGRVGRAEKKRSDLKMVSRQFGKPREELRAYKIFGK